MTSKSTPWVAGAVVLSLVVVALGWFLAIAPTLASAGAAHAEAETSDTRNAQLQVQLTALEQQFAELDTTKAELAAMHAQVPTTDGLADYTRTLQAVAEATGVTVLGIEAGDPEQVVPAVPVADAAAATGSEEADETAAAEESDGTDPAAAAPVAEGPQPIAGFVGLPMRISVVGSSEAVLTFLDRTQQGTDRLLLVTELAGTGQNAAEASAGRAATNDGDLELAISGFVYALAPSGSTDTGDEPLGELPAGSTPQVSGA